MLPIKYIRSETELVKTSMANRNIDFDMDKLLGLDDRRREILSELEALRSRRNHVSKEVGKIKKEGGDAAHLFVINV